MSISVNNITIHPKRIAKILFGTIIVLVFLNAIAVYLRLFPDRYPIFGSIHKFFVDMFIGAFTLNAEVSVPTCFSTLMLATTSILFFVIATQKRKETDRFKVHWTVLSFTTLLFSIDEIAGFHEQLSKLFKNFPNIKGLFYFKWVIPGLVFVFLFGFAYFIFFLHLEKKFKVLFLLSAGLYFGGALGLEMIGSLFASDNGLIYWVISSIEEILELLGTALLIYSLLLYLENYLPQLNFSIDSNS
mgnify:CR=1 FL=1